MSYNLDGHFAALDAELHQAIVLMHRSRPVQSRSPAASLMNPVLSAFTFFSKQCEDTPGLDYLVGIRGATAEIRAERSDRIAILRIEYDGVSSLRIVERRFGGTTEAWSTERTGTPEDAVQECVEFIARHIARIRPELAQDANSRPSEAGIPLPERQTPFRDADDAARGAAANYRSLGPAVTAERRRPRSR